MRVKEGLSRPLYGYPNGRLSKVVTNSGIRFESLLDSMAELALVAMLLKSGLRGVVEPRLLDDRSRSTAETLPHLGSWGWE